MRRLLTGAVIAALALALTASAHAGRGGGGGGGRPGGGMHHSNHSSHSSHDFRSHRNSGHVSHGNGKHYASSKFTGQKFGSRWRFHGKHGHYWSRTCWSRKYGCECYYCPTTCCWYYWCEGQVAYLPLSEYEDNPPQAPATTASAAATAAATAAGLPTTGPDGEPLQP
jgi:hypothetical protein